MCQTLHLLLYFSFSVCCLVTCSFGSLFFSTPVITRCVSPVNLYFCPSDYLHCSTCLSVYLNPTPIFVFARLLCYLCRHSHVLCLNYLLSSTCFCVCFDFRLCLSPLPTYFWIRFQPSLYFG